MAWLTHWLEFCLPNFCLFISFNFCCCCWFFSSFNPLIGKFSGSLYAPYKNFHSFIHLFKRKWCRSWTCNDSDYLWLDDLCFCLRITFTGWLNLDCQSNILPLHDQALTVKMILTLARMSLALCRPPAQTWTQRSMQPKGPMAQATRAVTVPLATPSTSPMACPTALVSLFSTY